MSGELITTVAGLLDACAAGGTWQVAGQVFELGSAVLSPVSGTTLIGVYGETVLRKSTTSGVSSYTSPIVRIVDARKVRLDGIRLEVPYGNTRQYAMIVRSTSQDATQDVVCDCLDTFNAPIFIERYVDGFTLQNFCLDGGGANGALGGIATGGQVNDDGSGTINTDGECRRIRIMNGKIMRMRQEAIDLNWNTVDVVVQGITVRDVCLDGMNNEAIDIGGATALGAPNCRDITLSACDIESKENALKIKQWSENVKIFGNILRYNGASGQTYCGIKFQNAINCDVFSNLFDGFATMAYYEQAEDRAHFRHNDGLNITSRGIISVNNMNVPSYYDCDISGNRIKAAAGATGRGIELNCGVRCTLDRSYVTGFMAGWGLVMGPTSPYCSARNITVRACLDGILVNSQGAIVDGAFAESNVGVGIQLGNSQIEALGVKCYNNGADGAYQIEITEAATALRLSAKVHDDRSPRLARGIRVAAAGVAAAQVEVTVIGYLVTAVANSAGVTAPAGKTPGTWSQFITT